jgi:uncharacterized membrane protein
MSLEYEKKLEEQIHYELKNLPDVAAPATLVSRVMAAIELRRALPWFRRAWHTWPGSLQGLFIVTMAALIGGICFGVWEASHTATFGLAAHKVGGWFSSLSAIYTALNALAGAIVALIKQVNSTVLIAFLCAAGLGYALFLALGTVYFRVAFAKR